MHMQVISFLMVDLYKRYTLLSNMLIIQTLNHPRRIIYHKVNQISTNLCGTKIYKLFVLRMMKRQKIKKIQLLGKCSEKKLSIDSFCLLLLSCFKSNLYLKYKHLANTALFYEQTFLMTHKPS